MKGYHASFAFFFENLEGRGRDAGSHTSQSPAEAFERLEIVFSWRALDELTQVIVVCSWQATSGLSHLLYV